MDQATIEDIDNRLPEGTQVGGRYVIDGFLARGGFATVYRAHHEQIGRKLAIKVLESPPRASAGESFRRRFLQEAKLAALIDHPGVVNVFDFGVLPDERTYIAMDLLDGHDLEQQLVSGPMLASRLIPLFTDCLAALQEGHRQGIVHKDLQPSNLFLVKPGQPAERLVILDFGIARIFDDPDSRVTLDGGFSGTPAYLAPEYIRYQTVSPAIDVYQMGLILIECLTGVPAVESNNSMGYLLAHCINQIVLPKSIMNTSLGEVLLKAVKKEPAHRYADAGEFRAALLGIERDEFVETGEMAIVVDEPRPQPQGAKTLQFINITQTELREIVAAAALETKATEPDVADPAADATATGPGRGVAVALLVVAALLGAYVLGGLGKDVPAPPTEPAPQAVVAAAPAEQPTVQSVDAGEPDLVVVEPDMAIPVVVAPVKPRPSLRPKPIPVSKPAAAAKGLAKPPMLLSP